MWIIANVIKWKRVTYQEKVLAGEENKAQREIF